MKYSQSIVLGCIGAATLASAIPAGHFAPKHGHNGVVPTQQQTPETNLQQRSYDDDLIFLRDFFEDLSTRAFDEEDIEARSLLSAAAKVATKSAAKVAPKVAAKVGGVAKTAVKAAPKVAAKAGSTAGKTVGKTAPKVNSALHKLPTSNKKPLAGAKPGAHTAAKPGAHTVAKPGAHTAAKPGAHTAAKPGQKTPLGSKKPLAGAKPGAHNTLVKKPAGAKPNAVKKPTEAQLLAGSRKQHATDMTNLSNSRKQHTTDERNLANSRKQHTTDERNLANSRKQHTTDVRNQQRLQGEVKGERQRIQALEKQSEMWKNRAEGARSASYGGYAPAPYYRPAPAYNQWRRDIEDEADLFERELDFDEIDARDLDWVDEIDARDFDMFDEVDARDFDEEDLLEMRSIEDFEIDELD